MEVLNGIFEKGFPSFLSLLIVTALLCWLLDSFSERRVEFYNRRHPERTSAIRYLNLTIRFLIWAVGAMVILRQIKPLQSLGDTLLGASSIIAVIAGIAAQETFGNYIAGFFLAIYQPFKIGDVIYLKDRHIAGTVRDITFRHTVVETKIGTVITVPNTVMDMAVIEDLSSFGYSRPIEITVPLRTDLNRLGELYAALLEENGVPLDRSGSSLMLDSCSGNGYAVTLPLPAADLREYTERKTLLLPKLTALLQENGIELL